MKMTLTLLTLAAAVTLPSCVLPGDYQTGVSSVGVGYGTYATQPPNYAGSAYYYGGRYYSGGRYEDGRFHDHGRTYTNRYYHNGRYYYGGRHEHHGAARPVNYSAPPPATAGSLR